ncbi:DNA-binding transcriptional MerR regulator [Kineosphaera limosa]|uniref:Putative MerR family transcriptional regulator n=1 Tax=Kineosphaera limosa NBRC 100340 TaxID=1184609 RepID=K6WXF8_9MICO|nr:MerR family transcriptional regulator [Kineosphaera limosa]NYE00678.1 DNA-binding transcriptional MerR regulator [Kineosphaera limosa]GAB96767.1 putative MerR family transcriptional regulator [Kineosphaera limosa NBRC 100340]
MRLKELAATSETSVASIKYYLREGLLPPGRAVNARLAEYDDSHVRRLMLIAALRGIIGASIEDIAALLRRVDDPDTALFDVLGDAQLLGLGLPPSWAGPAATDRAAGTEPAVVTALMEERGWSGEAHAVRAALSEHVARMQALNIPIAPDLLSVYADAADSVAGRDLGRLAATESRDEAVLFTAVGVHSFGGLLTRLVAVAQAAYAERSTQGPR